MKNVFFKKTLALAAATITILTTQLTGFAVTDTTPPTTPTNLTYYNVQASTATLEWTPSTDNVGVRGYQLFEGSNLWETRYYTDGTMWYISGLAPNSYYSFKVRAFDAAGNYSDFSNIITFNTPPDTQAPDAPQYLRCVARSGPDWGLDWNAPYDNVGVTLYHLYYYMDGNTTPITYSYETESQKGVTLQPGHTYVFYVTALDAAGNVSAPSNSYTISF